MRSLHQTRPRMRMGGTTKEGQETQVRVQTDCALAKEADSRGPLQGFSPTAAATSSKRVSAPTATRYLPDRFHFHTEDSQLTALSFPRDKPDRYDPATVQNNPLALLAAAVPGSSMAPPAFFPLSSSSAAGAARSQTVHRPNSQSSTANSRGSNLYRPPTVTARSPKDPSAGPIEYDTPASHIGSSTTSSTNLSLWDVAQAKEAALSNLGRGGAAMKPTASANPPSDLQPDPIDLGKFELLTKKKRPASADRLLPHHSLGIVSEPEAEHLFEHFHREMNPFIILFDKHLHTVEFARSTSTVLFTTLLAVSAKFARPDLYTVLRSHAMQLIGRGIMDGRATLGLIQSILCQIYWKVREGSLSFFRPPVSAAPFLTRVWLLLRNRVTRLRGSR